MDDRTVVVQNVDLILLVHFFQQVVELVRTNELLIYAKFCAVKTAQKKQEIRKLGSKDFLFFPIMGSLKKYKKMEEVKTLSVKTKNDINIFKKKYIDYLLQ